MRAGTVTSPRRRPVLAATLLATALSACIDESALRQPTLDIVPGAPPGWIATAGTPGVGLAVSDARTGANSAYLSGAFQSGFGVYRLYQNIRADNYRGQRVRLSGWVKPRNVGSVSVSGIFMRVDGPGVALELDDMSRRPVFGLGDWRLVEVVLDVPERAVGISFGAQFQASNTLLVDDLRFEVVSASVANTNMLSEPISNGLDSVGTVELYRRSPAVPVNLGFEGLASLSGPTAAWLTTNGSVLASVDPGSDSEDLAPFTAMVGDARVIGLGEGTYGTREFVQLKHRMIRHLVTTMGFTTLAVDAPMAEVADLDLYLQGGDGDLASLQSSLYAWHLDTREFGDLLTWIRERNIAVTPELRTHVVGLDVLYPGASMDSVAEFVKRVAPEYTADIAVWYECLDIFRNRGDTPGRPRAEYAATFGPSKALCAEGINDALNLVTSRGSGAPDYQSAIRHARLVKQFEAVYTNGSAALATRARETALADNLLALLDGNAGARVAVWAHNDRVTRQAGAMGAQLHDQLGAHYRPMAFTFGTGSFNALLQQGTSTGAPQSFTVQFVLQGSVEEAAVATGAALLLLDARKVTDGSADAAPLIGPVAMRTMGLGFDPNGERASYPVRLFPADFDLLMFVRATTPTTLLGSVN